MGDLIGILVVIFIVLIIAIFIVRALLRMLFRGVTKVGAKVGGTVAEVGVLAAEASGREVKDREKIISAGKKIGGVAGVVGTVLVAGEIADVDEVDTALDSSLGDADFSSGIEDGIDLDNDGVIEGYDTTGDGVIDTNVDGVEITGLEDVEGYTKADGTKVDNYVRTPADESTANNLRPKK